MGNVAVQEEASILDCCLKVCQVKFTGLGKNDFSFQFSQN